MNRRSIFAGLFAALPGIAKVLQAAPIGDLISDCREWKEGEKNSRCYVFVDGVQIAGVTYINFTKEFVRTIEPFQDGEAVLAYSDAAFPEGTCSIRRGDKWHRVPMPEGCFIDNSLLVRTIYGKIETRPL